MKEPSVCGHIKKYKQMVFVRTSQPLFICSKTTTETPERFVKSVQG